MMKNKNEFLGSDGHSASAKGLEPFQLKDVSAVLTWLHAIQVASGTDASKKFSLLTAGLTDPTLRQIADEAAHKSREVIEHFSSRRKAGFKKEFETPRDKVKYLKQARLRTATKLKAGDKVFFLTPKNRTGGVYPDKDVFVGKSGVINTPEKQNLMSQFDDTETAQPLEDEERQALIDRLETELDNGVYTDLEMTEAHALVAQDERNYKAGLGLYSTLKEAEAVQDVYNLACVYILKFAANEELTKCRDASTGRFQWDVSSTAVDNYVLQNHSEELKSRAHNIPAGTPARAAISQFELDSIKYEWFISLLLDRVKIPEKVASMKSLLVGKLETMLDSGDSLLRNLVAADSEIRAGTKTKFEFYKYHLGLQSAAKPPAPTVRFMSPDHTGCDTPSAEVTGNPDTFIGAMGSGGNRPLSSNPHAKCVGERRSDVITRQTTVDASYEPGSRDTDGFSSDRDDRGSNPKRKRSDRSLSPPPKRMNLRSEKGKGENQKGATLDQVVRLIGDLTKKTSDLEQKVANSNPRGKPPFTGKRDYPVKKRVDSVVPGDACPHFVKGGPCKDRRCAANHGKFQTKYRGQQARLCRSEEGGGPCPFLWTEKGCYSRHTCSKNE